MQYEKETEEKSRKIRETEADNIKVGKKKQRGEKRTGHTDVIQYCTQYSYFDSVCLLICFHRPDKLSTSAPVAAESSG